VSVYKNAGEVLPRELLRALQDYFEGELVYVPVRKKRAWGEQSGARAQLRARNDEIRARYRRGKSLDSLAAQYCLSTHTIRKIVRGTRLLHPRVHARAKTS